MNKNLVIFDGSNFYHSAKKLAPEIHLTNFNYQKLVQLISQSQNNIAEYCVGEIRKELGNSKSKRMYASQQTLFYNLEQQGIVVKKGFMLRTDSVYHEKGVDVRIALDILGGAFRNEYNQCFLISTDTDIIPAIDDAKALGKIIIYVGFENFMSKALRTNSSGMVLITRNMLEACAKR